ncbi:hemerythrin domain-containing protein [Hoeflea sp. YIM 152468]|uniref:hemerythrin domain-containing protein n=1 Tax=Hoeflea sp. YIM 152468 TaxID=3031759 RepID=UPI0023DC53A4|nr:hemerythrin domain-containing protein [Hoeflea sp. YIM 152468]MDF1607778.1 hemerythrin domain-containing protein [Hoeflea sp. YIM 152468]
MTKDATVKLSQGDSPISALRKAHDAQLQLCDRLEEIADSLPDRVNRQKCIYASRALGPMIRETHRFEEDVVFPLIADRLKHDRTIAATLGRLRSEHCEDECFAEELSEALHALGTGRVEINIEATGYMLRGFFEATRRHIAFESEHLLSNEVLSAAGLTGDDHSRDDQSS